MFRFLSHYYDSGEIVMKIGEKRGRERERERE